MIEPETARFQAAFQRLMEAFNELQADAEARHLGPAESETIEVSPEQDSAIDDEIASRVKTALRGVLAAAEFETGEVAFMIAFVSDALVEIDPTLSEDDEDEEDEFENDEDEDEEEEEDGR